jgi:hypothetical protein
MRTRTILLLMPAILLELCPAAAAESAPPAAAPRGVYFQKKTYVREALPTFDSVRQLLPEPLLASKPEWLALYWKCWCLAFAHLKQPEPASPLVSNWLDEAFSPNIFQWDTCFMMMFARYGHYQFQSNGRRSANTPHGLYWNTSLGSGLDNTPKPTAKGAGWVDMSCQMVMQYRDIARICRVLGLLDKAVAAEAEARAIGERINHWCWDEQEGFYYDVLADGSKFRKQTACGFWPLIAGITSPAQAARLVVHLKDPAKFWRPVVFPTLAADAPEYKADGGYWLGGVWAPTNYAIIKGLEQTGYDTFAAAASERYLAAMADVYQHTGTVTADLLYDGAGTVTVHTDQLSAHRAAWDALWRQCAVLALPDADIERLADPGSCQGVAHPRAHLGAQPQGRGHDRLCRHLVRARRPSLRPRRSRPGNPQAQLPLRGCACRSKDSGGSSPAPARAAPSRPTAARSSSRRHTCTTGPSPHAGSSRIRSRCPTGAR